MSASTMPVPYACMLKPQCDSRRVTGALAYHAPIEPAQRHHLRVVMWFNVRPLGLDCWSRTTHGDSGILQERDS